MLHRGGPWGNFSPGKDRLLVKGSFGPVTLFMGEARGIVVGAYDDMTYGVTAADLTQLHGTPLIGGPAPFGTSHVAAEACTDAPTHAVTSRE